MNHKHSHPHHAHPSGEPGQRGKPSSTAQATADHTAHANHAGPDTHNRHAGHSVAMFRDRFWITLLLTVPTMVWSEMIQHWFGYTAPAFTSSDWVPALFGSAVFLYGGKPFLQGALQEIRHRLPGMMTLISLAIAVAFVFSRAVSLGAPGTDLWWELATLVAIMLLGHWIEMASITQAQGALRALAKLLPDKAVRLTADGGHEDVPVSELKTGDVLLIRPGASIPADGEVREGKSAVNESMITGESKPVDKTVDSKVIAGTLNGQGSLRVEVTRTGEQTALAGIMRLVEQAQQSRSRAQALADRAARWLTFAAIAAAIVTAAVWTALGASWAYTIERVVTVLVIACPHALGLAVPLVIAISTTLGVQHGLLIRDRRGLEEARSLNIVVFDKTGTLTLAEHRVVAMATDGNLADDEVFECVTERAWGGALHDWRCRRWRRGRRGCGPIYGRGVPGGIGKRARIDETVDVDRGLSECRARGARDRIAELPAEHFLVELRGNFDRDRAAVILETRGRLEVLLVCLGADKVGEVASDGIGEGQFVCGKC